MLHEHSLSSTQKTNYLTSFNYKLYRASKIVIFTSILLVGAAVKTLKGYLYTIVFLRKPVQQRRSDTPTWRYFTCNLKKDDVACCGKLSGVRGSQLLAKRAGGGGRNCQCCKMYLLAKKIWLPLNLEASHTHVLLFQTACEMTSCHCIDAGQVSAKKHNCVLLGW